MSEFQFPASVIDGAAVDDALCAFARRCQRYGSRQDIRRAFAVNIKRAVELIIEHDEVDAEVDLLRGLPLQIGISGRGLRKTGWQRSGIHSVEVVRGSGLLLTVWTRARARTHRVREQRRCRVARRINGRAGGGADLLVAVRAVAQPKFQIVDPIDLEKFFLREAPAHRRRGKYAPSIV